MKIIAKPLSRQAFEPYGEVIDAAGAVGFPINGGKCTRFHDLANIEALGPNAKVLINVFRGQAYNFPLTLSLVERHPFGSQAFMPLEGRPFLVAVCRDTQDGPGTPDVFVTGPGQGVNYARNIWHAVLTPIGSQQDFLVVDRGGDGSNLEEHEFETPFEIHLPENF